MLYSTLASVLVDSTVFISAALVLKHLYTSAALTQETFHVQSLCERLARPSGYSGVSRTRTRT